jgi:hypothetical protein
MGQLDSNVQSPTDGDGSVRIVVFQFSLPPRGSGASCAFERKVWKQDITFQVEGLKNQVVSSSGFGV